MTLVSCCTNSGSLDHSGVVGGIEHEPTIIPRLCVRPHGGLSIFSVILCSFENLKTN